VAAILQILKNPAYAGAFVYGRTRTVHTDPASPRAKQVRLSQQEWKIRVPDVYPAYISWQTFEQIQSMLADNYAAYDRNKTRGGPRPGAALLQGMVACGECGHRMVIEYKHNTRYLCNYLRQQYRVPVCQYIPADAVDAQVVEAFFQALSPLELDVYEQAVAAQQAEEAQVTHAHEQRLSRLRYEASLAQRQFLQVDPDNRLVAAELEKRWEAALAELKRAEEAIANATPSASPLLSLPPELQAAFGAIGQHLPGLWRQGRIKPGHQKALLRCLIDLVVVRRPTLECVEVRIVWRGGATTDLQVPVPVGSLADLAGAPEMERIILARSGQGASDEVIAEELTAQGYRSPMRLMVLPSTVKSIRLKHGIFQVRSQSHPRQVKGALTLSQVAKALDIAPHWIYDRINNGCIQVSKDAQTNLYLFPDDPATLEQFQQLRAGILKELRFSKEHQDA
jgi:hypothetical protein